MRFLIFSNRDITYRCIKILLSLLAIMVVSTTIWVAYYRYYNPSETHLMRIRIAEAKRLKKNFKISYAWRDYDNISIGLAKAVIISEDTSFFSHHGFNFKAIRLAYLKNRELGIDKYGASTISQQTAKNLFLWNGKSWLRKGLEAYFTVLIEQIWGKRRILEIYLNIVEYGDGVFGAEAASLRYFKISSSKLNQLQASMLAKVLPNPRGWNLAPPSKGLILKARLNRIQVRINKRFFKAMDWY